MTTMNNQEQTIIVPLGKALQDARLSASLTVEEVAEQLNLAVSTVRDLEDDLDNVIENKKYPPTESQEIFGRRKGPHRDRRTTRR